jgi:Flp pilus assembly protein TadD
MLPSPDGQRRTTPDPEEIAIMSGKTRREQIEEMLRDDPNDPFLRYGLAMEHVSAGDDEGAVRCFRELVAVAPTYVAAYLQAGQALTRLNRTQEAADTYRQGMLVARQQNDQHAVGEMEGLLNMLD